MKAKLFCFPILCIFFIISCKKNKNTLEVDNKKYYDALTAAENCQKNDQLDSAFYFYNLSKNVVINDSSNNKLIYSLSYMSIIQQTQSDFVGSENTATEALSYFNKYSNLEYLSGLYNTLGLNYNNIFDFDSAEKNYNLAIENTKIKDDLLSFKNNIAVLAIDDLKYEKAQKLFNKLLIDNKIDYNNIENNKNIHARILDNMGYCLFKNNQSNSLDYFQKALAIKLKINDGYGLISSYMHLSEYFQKTNKNLEIEYAKKALAQSEKLNCPDEKLKAMEILIANNIGNYQIKYFNLNDSLKKARQQSKNQFAKIRFDSKKTIAENQILRSQKTENDLKIATQRNKILVLSILGIIGVFGSLFIYQRMNFRNKSEKIKISYNTETRISKKVHDELANDVFNVMTFAITQNLEDEAKKEKLINSLDDVYTRTRDISRENNIIETGENFTINLKEMLSQYNNTDLNIIISGLDFVKWNNINSNKKITIYRVLQELVINLKKHSKASVCVANFKQFGKKVQINFSDNGVGMRLDKKNSRNGLQNMENRILAINGTITFDSEPKKGFKVMIQFPE